MPRLEYFFAAQEIIRDARSSRVTAVNVLDEFSPARYPLVVVRCSTVCAWLLDESDFGQDFQAEIRVYRPGIKTPDRVKANFTGENRLHHIIHNFSSMPLVGPGELRFTIYLDGQEAASHRILLNQADPDRIENGDFIYVQGDIDPDQNTLEFP